MSLGGGTGRADGGLTGATGVIPGAMRKIALHVRAATDVPPQNF